MKANLARQNKLVHIADLMFAQYNSQEKKTQWSVAMEALEQAYELAVRDCVRWVRDAEGDSVASDMKADLGVSL